MCGVKVVCYFLYTDGTEINGERNVTICGIPETVEYVAYLDDKMFDFYWNFVCSEHNNYYY